MEYKKKFFNGLKSNYKLEDENRFKTMANDFEGKMKRMNLK